MNWFLLLLILKLFTINWAAPIELVENKDEFQQDNLINKAFSVNDEANNFFTTSEALVNGTVNAFNSSSLNESPKENLHKIKEDLHNVSSEVQKELEQYLSQDTTEESFEIKPTSKESSSQVTEIITVSTFNSSSLNKSPKENFHKIKEDLHNFSSEVQKELEQHPSQDTTEESFEIKPASEESSAQVTEIITVSTFNSSSLNESPKENFHKIKEDLYNFSAEIQKEFEQHPSQDTTEESFEIKPASEESSAQVTDIITVSAFNSSSLNESPKENFHIIKEDLHNFSSEVQKELEQYPSQDTTEESIEIKPASEESSAQVTEIISFDVPLPKEEVSNEQILMLTQNPVENLTEHAKEILQEFSNSSRDNIITANTESRSNTLIAAEPVDATHALNTETLISNTDTIVDNLDNLSNQYPSLINHKQQELSSVVEQSASIQDSSNVNNVQESLAPELHEKKVEEIFNAYSSVENFNGKLQQNHELPLLFPNQDIVQQTSTEEAAKVYQEESSSESSALKETVDYLAEGLVNVATMIQESAENSSIPNDKVTVSEYIPETEVSIENHAEKSPIFKEAVDSFIDDVAEIGSKFGLIIEQKPEEKLGGNEDSINMEKLEEIPTSSANPLDNSTEQLQQNSKIPLSINNNENPQPSTTEESSTAYQVETSSESSALKQTVDAFINQVAEIGSSSGKAADEIISDASIKQSVKSASEQIPVTTENENINQESSTDSEVKTEDISYSSNTNFKESLDSLAGKLDEIANNLDSNKTGDITDETIATIPASLENLEENQTNIPAVAEYTRSFNFGRSAKTLIASASEIDNNFGQPISNLFSTIENKQETVIGTPNETSTETITQSEQNKSENLQILPGGSSLNAPVEIIQEDTSKSHVIYQENIEVSSTTQYTKENFVYSADNSVKTLNESHEVENIKTQESENLSGKNSKESPTEQNLGEFVPKQTEKSTQFAEYIPVAVTTIPEGETEIQQSINSRQYEIDHLNFETKATEEQFLLEETKTASEEVQINSEIKATEEKEHVQDSQIEETIKENKQPEPAEATHQEDFTTKAPITERETTIKTREYLNEGSTSESIKTEEYTTSSPITQETTNNAHPAIEETTNAFNKFENTLKTLIQQEKLKQQEKHLSTLEISQLETSTLVPNSRSFTTVKEESNTLLSQDETTMLPKNFEEELKMAVKALEETTHHHFEEFQNNLKEAFKKFTVWGAEHEGQGQMTTFKSSQGETTETGTTQQSLNEQISTMKNEEETTFDTINDKVEETSTYEEPHRIGAINQNFVDQFADNYQENSEVTTTEVQREKEEYSHLSGVQETEIKKEEATERIFTLTTMSPLEDDEEVKSSQEEQLKQFGSTSPIEVTTLPHNVEENSTPTAENFVQEKTKETATEAETTTVPLLARVPLQKDINSVSLTTVEEAATETLTQESTTQHHKSEQSKETHTELTHTETTQPTERMQEIITLSSPESSLQEMVTFIEHGDTTTVKQEQATKEVEENTATSQTQEPLTQAAFMEEQQQQIESTTEHEAQTHTAAASGHTTDTTTITEDDTSSLQQQTTEAEIYSTTIVEKEEEETTVASITSTTAAVVEPEARSLALPPPKLEYLQNEDGVEVFYGYSIVKHN